MNLTIDASVFVSAAEDFDAVLISWDEELLQRSPEFLLAMSPEKGLEKPTRTGGLEAN